MVLESNESTGREPPFGVTVTAWPPRAGALQKLSPADIQKLKEAQRNNRVSE
jgi:hypothetical protein